MARARAGGVRHAERRKDCSASQHGKGIVWDATAVPGVRSRWHICTSCGQATPEGGRVREPRTKPVVVRPARSSFATATKHKQAAVWFDIVTRAADADI